MREYYETVNESIRDGYEIKLEMTPETDAPDWDFESEADRLEVLRKIDAGVYLWFVARVSAWRDGEELACDYLGGCCYDSVDDFIYNSGYYEDMVATVVQSAQEKVNVVAEMGV